MKRSRRPKKPSRHQRLKDAAFNDGYTDGFRTAVDQMTSRITKVEAEMTELKMSRNLEILRQSGQAISSLAQLSEGFARTLMYGSGQRFPGKDQKNLW